ncbi:hypothetical protein BDA96_05G065900 [Sorghum bicolor]|uniref:Uncharacterized protein n=1 Tax=Sorghum bicolor TaxID=4558 RepID=A0A921QVA6_SORBI|nr:hypothetical protein BDA96_05G065900 [Sorghum bicolor]
MRNHPCAHDAKLRLHPQSFLSASIQRSVRPPFSSLSPWSRAKQLGRSSAGHLLRAFADGSCTGHQWRARATMHPAEDGKGCGRNRRSLRTPSSTTPSAPPTSLLVSPPLPICHAGATSPDARSQAPSSFGLPHAILPAPSSPFPSRGAKPSSRWRSGDGLGHLLSVIHRWTQTRHRRRAQGGTAPAEEGKDAD